MDGAAGGLRVITARRRPATFELARYVPVPPRAMPPLPEMQSKLELAELVSAADQSGALVLPSADALARAEAALPATWERHVRAEFTTALFRFYQLSKGRVTSITRDYGMWTPRAVLAGCFEIAGARRPLYWAAGTAMTNRLHAKLVLAACLDTAIVSPDIAAMHDDFCRQVEHHQWDAEPQGGRLTPARRASLDQGIKMEAPAVRARRLDQAVGMVGDGFMGNVAGAGATGPGNGIS